MQNRFPSNTLILMFIFLIAFQDEGKCLPLYLNQDPPLQQNIISAQDSTKADSIITEIDSVKTPKTSSVGLDTILKYDASVVDTRVQEKKIYLIGSADVKYKTMHLTAEKITVDWETNLITAEGTPDTVYKPTDVPGDSVMTIVWKGLPTLADAGDVMRGSKMIYNYKTEKGRVLKGRTEFEGGYYLG